MIDELTQRDSIVLATGGGAILREENRTALSQRGSVVYLYASIRQQFERTSKDRNRPLLQVPDPEGRLRELMAERDPLYREIADHVVETDGLPARTVAQQLSRALKAD
jgi:shikimate kinase